ncbi:hypothetical protein DIPPA_25410 [Diplonema papillatum]|nr:hypothetical protein DIPPA_25410 [Diplonema papillatum]
MKRDSTALSDITGVTGNSCNDLAQTLVSMEHIMQSKRQKKTQKVGELHQKLLHKVRAELDEIAEGCRKLREENLQNMAEKVKAIRGSGGELKELECGLNDKYTEMEDCQKGLDDLAVQREELRKTRQNTELEHRQEALDSYRKLKSSVEEVLNACMKGLSKNYEATSQMKKMRAFLQQLEQVE